jgi:hypothetical protein
LCCLLLVSCGAAPQYVTADRATFEAVAPEYLKYVDADPALDVSARESRHLTVLTWEMRLKAAEAQK